VNINSGGRFVSFPIFDGNVVSNMRLNLFDGGVVENSFIAQTGAVVEMAGGKLGGSFLMRSGSALRISGGVFGDFLTAQSGSELRLSGGEFMMNGQPIGDLTGGLPDNGVFTGVLADGSVFIIGGELDFENIAPGAAVLDDAPPPPVDTTPLVVSTGMGPRAGLRAGQSLTLRGDGALREDFAAVGATLDIEGGSVGAGLELAFTEMNITGGTIGGGMNAYTGSRVRLAGGSIGDGAIAFAGSVVDIGGGSVGQLFTAADGALVNISGGQIGDAFGAMSGATVRLFVTELFINGAPVGLTLGEERLITQRGGALLEARLADGSLLNLNLNTSINATLDGEDFFEFGSALTATLVPAPGGLGLFGLAACWASRRRRRA